MSPCTPFDDKYVLCTLHSAPRHDLALLHVGLCTLLKYRNTKIARVTTTAILSHLWDLSEILIAFALLKDAATKEEKHLMLAALHKVEGWYEPLKRIQPFQHRNTKTLHNFLIKKHKQLLTILGISQEF